MSRGNSLRVPFVVLALLVSATIAAQAVTVRRTGENMAVRAPAFTFIKGETLARLKDGRSVRVDLTLAILPKAGAAHVTQAKHTFVLSYDLWEERFAAAILGSPARSAAYLSVAAAEAWCLEQLLVPITAMGSLAKAFWIRLEYRIQDDGVRPAGGDASDALQGIIDALSRRSKTGELANSIEAGPFRLQ